MSTGAFGETLIHYHRLMYYITLSLVYQVLFLHCTDEFFVSFLYLCPDLVTHSCICIFNDFYKTACSKSVSTKSHKLFCIIKRRYSTGSFYLHFRSDMFSHQLNICKGCSCCGESGRSFDEFCTCIGNDRSLI